jgi:hypothetical protein
MITKKPLSPVKIILPSLDDYSNPPVLRGVVDPFCLPFLQVDTSYQRERMTPSARKEIVRALESAAKLPDVELGMRGQRFNMPDNNTAELLDPTYIIDGYQRVSTIIEHLERFPTDTNNIRLGAVVHFGTTREYERDRFQVLNLFRQRVAPSVLLRNAKEEHPMIATLYGLSKARDGLLYGRVCWSQNMTRGELVTGLVFAQISLELHRRFTATSRTTREIPDTTDRLLRAIGLPLARANVQTFWEVIDDAWGIRAVQHKGGAVYLKSTFLRTLAQLFNDYRAFWTAPDNKKFVVPTELRRKLARFKINDPEISRLAGAGGKAVETLYFQMFKHFNSGKRTKKLVPWDPASLPTIPIVADDEDEDEDEDEDNAAA